MVLIKGAHTATEFVNHFTFIPKYRKRVLEGKIKQRLEGMIKFCAQVNDWKIVELSIQPDHVHLLIQTRGDDSPSEVMQAIKGGTSRKIRELFPNLEESIWSKGFWADGYYGGSVGTRDLETVKAYVKNQTKHHSMKPGRKPTGS